MLPVVIAAALANLTLDVDARDVRRQLWHVVERIPLDGGAGPVTLLYPKWIPGAHGPVGPVGSFGNVRASVPGTAGTATAVRWRRDLDDVYTFAFDVPAGARELDLTFDAYEGGTPSNASPELAVLDWNDVVLYPKGATARGTRVNASIELPPAWSSACALDPAPYGRTTPGRITFPETTLETLIDSPLYAGRYARVWPLYAGPGGATAELDAFAETPAALAAPPSFATHAAALVREGLAAFGARHWLHYHFLLELSDVVQGRGLEHHASSENGTIERGLVDDEQRDARVGGLIAHEFTHSWNGKYRRPAGLATPDYQQPMVDDLLWVYEGMTQYYGEVLAVRSGLTTPDALRGNLANWYATLDAEPGRRTRPLLDTAVAQGLTRGAQSLAGRYQRRAEDYYTEAALMWLDADTLIRERSAGARSLDDVARRFFGPPDSLPTVVPYTRDDLVAALQAVQPYDWRGFLAQRVDAIALHPPSAGFTRGGYRLVFRSTPTPRQRRAERGGPLDARFSLGSEIGADGSLPFVIEGSPLALAGLGPGMKILAVDDHTYSHDRMHDALAQATRDRAPLRVTYDDLGTIRTAEVDYHGGDRYPRLERAGSAPALLDRVAAARTGTR